jgi:hypothetical protein
MASAVTLPLIGAIVGGVATWGALSGGALGLAGISTVAKVALTGAGIVGGAVIGQIGTVALNIFGFAALSGGLLKAKADNETALKMAVKAPQPQPAAKTAFQAGAERAAEVNDNQVPEEILAVREKAFGARHQKI